MYKIIVFLSLSFFMYVAWSKVNAKTRVVVRLFSSTKKQEIYVQDNIKQVGWFLSWTFRKPRPLMVHSSSHVDCWWTMMQRCAIASTVDLRTTNSMKNYRISLQVCYSCRCVSLSKLSEQILLYLDVLWNPSAMKQKKIIVVWQTESVVSPRTSRSAWPEVPLVLRRYSAVRSARSMWLVEPVLVQLPVEHLAAFEHLKRNNFFFLWKFRIWFFYLDLPRKMLLVVVVAVAAFAFLSDGKIDRSSIDFHSKNKPRGGGGGGGAKAGGGGITATGRS